MFADTELTKSCEIQIQLEGIKPGHLYSLLQSGKHSFILACAVDGVEKVLKIPACRVRRAIKRTANNPEDVKVRTFWDRIFG
jgi:predicted Ser/Thr protein kinase